MKSIAGRLAPLTLILLGALAAPVVAPQPAAAAEIRQVVNGAVITSFDVQRRAAFLRVQGRRGNANQAALDEMVEQTLRSQEMSRIGVRISQQQIDEAYANFGRSNNLSVRQLDQVLAQANVTKDHFKEFIRVQMGWGQLLQARASSEGQSAGQTDALRELAKRGGTKPTATEYILQQFVFVVPERERGRIMGRRKNEAQAMRQRVNSCENTREIAKTVLDVTVRDLGRVLEPELPPDWEKFVKATGPGQTTNIRETPRGVEFLVVCSTRQVNDDRVAELVFKREEIEKAGGNAGEALNKKYMAELRERARISAR